MPKPAIILVGAIAAQCDDFIDAGFLVECAPTERPSAKLINQVRDKLLLDSSWDGKLYIVGGSLGPISRYEDDQTPLPPRGYDHGLEGQAPVFGPEP